jgi:hypothetical protein
MAGCEAKGGNRARKGKGQRRCRHGEDPSRIGMSLLADSSHTIESRQAQQAGLARRTGRMAEDGGRMQRTDIGSRAPRARWHWMGCILEDKVGQKWGKKPATSTNTANRRPGGGTSAHAPVLDVSLAASDIASWDAALPALASAAWTEDSTSLMVPCTPRIPVLTCLLMPARAAISLPSQDAPQNPESRARSLPNLAPSPLLPITHTSLPHNPF